MRKLIKITVEKVSTLLLRVLVITSFFLVTNGKQRFFEGLRTSCQSEGSAPKPRKRHPETCFCLMRRERRCSTIRSCAMLGRAFNSKPFRTAPPKQHDAKERLHGSDRCPCSHISRQDRLASGRTPWATSTSSTCSAKARWSTCCPRSSMRHHALHRAFGGHDAGQRGIHQQLHRRAVPTAPRVHRVHGHAPGLSRA